MEKYLNETLIYNDADSSEKIEAKITDWIQNHPHATIDHIINLPGRNINGSKRILILYSTGR